MIDTFLLLVIILVIASAVDKKVQNYYKDKGTDGMNARIFVYGTFLFIFLVIKFFLTIAKY